MERTNLAYSNIPDPPARSETNTLHRTPNEGVGTESSYPAKIRGLGEPEFSTLRTRDLNSFLRQVETFIMDRGSFLFLSLLAVHPFRAPKCMQEIRSGQIATNR